MKKLVVILLAAFVLSVVTGYAGEPVKKAEPKKVEPKKAETGVTITGTVALTGEGDKKVLVIQTEAADVPVADNPKALELAKNVGKKVKATGVIKEVEGKKTITLKSFVVQKEEDPKKKEDPKKEPPKPQ